MRPAVFDHVYRQPRFSRRQVAIDFQIIIDARQRRLNRRRFRLALRGKGRLPQRTIIINRQHDPSIRIRGILRRDGYGAENEKGG